MKFAAELVNLFEALLLPGETASWTENIIMK